MPLYEYSCQDCGKKFTILCSISNRDNSYVCKNCQSLNTTRLVSRVKTIRSEDEILESLSDPSKLSGIDENDPSSMARWAKRMARDMGENMDDEIDSMAQEEFDNSGNDELAE